MTDLLPCPFCGSTDIYIAEDYYIYGSCSDCGTQGPAFEPERTNVTGSAFCLYDTKAAEAKAVEAWNRRAPSLFGRPIIESDDLPDLGEIVFG